MTRLSAAQFDHVVATTEQPAPVTMSPLVLADRLITLAKDADRGGFVVAADQLVRLAYAVWDGPAAARA